MKKINFDDLLLKHTYNNMRNKIKELLMKNLFLYSKLDIAFLLTKFF